MSTFLENVIVNVVNVRINSLTKENVKNYLVLNLEKLIMSCNKTFSWKSLLDMSDNTGKFFPHSL